jgi:hypothetical protein
MRVLIKHLIKWAIQPERREDSSWRSTIVTHRGELTSLLEQSPSLRPYAQRHLQRTYSEACRLALIETRVNVQLPDECPYNIKQILQLDWFPPDQ